MGVDIIIAALCPGVCAFARVCEYDNSWCACAGVRGYNNSSSCVCPYARVRTHNHCSARASGAYVYAVQCERKYDGCSTRGVVCCNSALHTRRTCIASCFRSRVVWHQSFLSFCCASPCTLYDFRLCLCARVYDFRACVFAAARVCANAHVRLVKSHKTYAVYGARARYVHARRRSAGVCSRGPRGRICMQCDRAYDDCSTRGVVCCSTAHTCGG